MRWILFLSLSLAASLLQAAGLQVTFTDQKSGDPVEDAVVTLHWRGEGAMPLAMPESQIMDQVDKTFVPHVLVLPVNTPVYFPNQDDIRHHVYSLDGPKLFELPLYKGTPADPVIFDRVGVVSLGCNIHDWMSGYIYVVDTPLYGRSDASGGLSIDGIPAGDYELRVWHPRIKDMDANTQPVSFVEADQQSMDIALRLRRQLQQRQRVRSRSGGY